MTEYRIEKFKTEYVSWKTGVSPRPMVNWRIIRVADGHVMESAIRTRKDAEWILRGLPK
jgi:hypothetical protein